MNDTLGSTTELEHRIGANGRFSLRTAAGSIAIHGIDGEVARVRQLSGRPLGERFSIDAGTGHLTLELRTRLGFSLQIGSRNMEDELEIEVPRSATLVIESASADVEATGLAGPKRFKSASGDLALVDVAGDLDVDAVSGDVTVDGNDRLDARIRTISGDLRLRAPSVSRLEAGTTSGDLRLDAELSGAGPFSVKSISGDMTIVSRGAFSVEAQTITGDLVTALEHRMSSAPGRKTLVIGRDGPTLQFKSVSGDLLIVEPRDAAARPTATQTGVGDQPAAGLAPESVALAPESAGTIAPRETAEPTTEPTELAAARLEVLRALERGDLSVEAATERLADLEVSVA
jgi:hypothetical protein